MAKLRNPRTPPTISPDEAHRLVKIADKATAPFVGNFEELESAVGMLFLGRLFGWKPLLIIHSRRTIKKYEEILGINIKEEFDEVGPWADKSRGWDWAQKLSNFWKAVSGDTPVPDRRGVE
jgi:hypothetical protein